MSLLDTLAPEFKPLAQELYDLAVRANVRPRVTSARRSYAKQQSLYQAYLQGRSRYPAAAPGTSAHEYGYAFDMVVDNSTDQTDLGSVWVQNFGQVYGGEEDPIHFQAASFQAPVAGGAAPSDQGIADKVQAKAAQLADILLPYINPFFGGILSIEVLTSSILRIAGYDSAALDFLTWGLSHPLEFLSSVYGALWKIVWETI